MSKISRRVQVLLGTSLLAVAISVAARVAAQIPSVAPGSETAPPAQPAYPNCQPPHPGEYLLLVVSKTPEAQDKVKRSLPPSAPAIVCTYVDEVVTRVSGFTSVDTANAWAKYLSDSMGLSAFVARPLEAASPQASPSPQVTVPPASVPQVTASPAPSSQPAKPTAQTSKPPTRTATTSSRNPLAFNPKPLGMGYAVLVNYYNRPELANQIQQLLGKEVGLVSYGQRPYLLATYTSNQSQAHTILQKLTDRGFWAVVVDSQQVLLLRQAVK